jgi:dipicolinate synthase subunit A
VRGLFSGRVLAVIGGDGREAEIARQALAEGASVRTYGQGGGARAGAEEVPDLGHALAGADAAIFPIPLPETDGSIFAPRAKERIRPEAEDFSAMAEGGAIVTGRATDAMVRAADRYGLHLIEYEGDEELMLLRAPAVAEGAVALAIQHTDVTLHRSPVLLTGFGKIGPSLGRLLVGMGARVTVAARNPVQRARALDLGCEAVRLEELPAVLPHQAVVFNTVPAPILTRAELALTAPTAVLIDLAAPPGGIDREAAKELGRVLVWARGLGGRAPTTVGRSQWRGIRERLADIWNLAREEARA